VNLFSPFRKDNSKIEYKVLAITIAFENIQVIEKQIQQFIRGNAFDNSFKLVIVDNSRFSKSSRAIKNICNEYAVDYYRLKKNPYSGIDPSKSHGFALNWAVKNISSRYKSTWIGFLDHDIFLLSDIHKLFEKLVESKSAYGVQHRKEGKWYLWPGLIFLKRKEVNIGDLDFMPVAGLDTGGGNWRNVFSGLAENKLEKIKVDTIFPEGKDKQNKQKDAIQVIDRIWLHLINASNWAGVDMSHKQEKLDILVETLIVKE